VTSGAGYREGGRRAGSLGLAGVVGEQGNLNRLLNSEIAAAESV
jgi:hypothetical protein